MQTPRLPPPALPSSSLVGTLTNLRAPQNATGAQLNSSATLTGQCHHPADDGQLYVYLNTFWYCFFALITAIGLLVSLVSNMIIIYLFTGTKSLRRNPSNIIAVNLSLSDLLYCLQWPSVIYCSLTQSTWMLEIEFVCNTFGFITTTTASASVLTVLAMSVERAIVIKYSIQAKSRYTIRSAWCIVVLIWVLSVSSSLPPLFGTFNRFTLDPSKTSCTIDYLSGKTNYKLYILVIYVAYWILPTVIISVCYTIILVTFRRSSNSLKEVDRRHSQVNSLGDPCVLTPAATNLGPFFRRELHHGSLRNSIRLNNLMGHLRRPPAGRSPRGQLASVSSDSDAGVELRVFKSVPDLTQGGPNAGQKEQSRRSASNRMSLRPRRLMRRVVSAYQWTRPGSSEASPEAKQTGRPAARDSLDEDAELGGAGRLRATEMFVCDPWWQKQLEPTTRQQSSWLGAGTGASGAESSPLTNSICRIDRKELAGAAKEGEQQQKEKSVEETATANNFAGENEEVRQQRLSSSKSAHWCRRKFDDFRERRRRSRRRISFDVARLRRPSSEGPPLGSVGDSAATGARGEEVRLRKRAQTVSPRVDRGAGQLAQRAHQLAISWRNSGHLMASDSDATISSATTSIVMSRSHQFGPPLPTSGRPCGQLSHQGDGRASRSARTGHSEPTSRTARRPVGLSAAAYAPSMSTSSCHIGNSRAHLSRTNLQIRLAKTSFYLILLWLVSWTPIASLAMINSVVKCHHRASALAVFLANTMTKLGPAFDVFIYGVSHPRIKRKFTLIIKRLLMMGGGGAPGAQDSVAQVALAKRGPGTMTRRLGVRPLVGPDCSRLAGSGARTFNEQIF